MPDGQRYELIFTVKQATRTNRRQIKLRAPDFDMRAGESLHAEFYVTQMGELGMRMLSWVDENGLTIDRHLRCRMFGPRPPQGVIVAAARAVVHVPNGGWELEIVQAIYNAMQWAVRSALDDWLKGVQRRNFRKLLLSMQKLTFHEYAMYGEFNSADLGWPLLDWAIQERWEGQPVEFRMWVRMTLPDQTVEDVDLSVRLSRQSASTAPRRRFCVHFREQLTGVWYLQLGLTRVVEGGAPTLIVGKLVASSEEEVPSEWVPLSRDNVQRHSMVDAAVRAAMAKANSREAEEQREAVAKAERVLRREARYGGDSSRQRTS